MMVIFLKKKFNNKKLPETVASLFDLYILDKNYNYYLLSINVQLQTVI